MIKKIFGILSVFVFTSAFAEEAIPPMPEQNRPYIEKENAAVQIMNKQAGKVQSVTIPVAKKVKFEKLEILVRKCLVTDEFLPEDFFMFVQVQKDGKSIFSGWMTKSEPGQNPLQDPDNDLWLVRCE